MTDTRDPNEMVSVQIWATERVRYGKTVEMTRAEFERHEAALDDAGVDEAPAENIMDKFIDRTEDWVDDSSYEVHSFEIVEPVQAKA